MKKIYIIVTLLIFSLSGKAQHEKGVATLQPKVGLNVANVTYGNADSRIGAAFGLEYEYMVADKIGISVAGMYSMQGDKATAYLEDYGKVTVTEKKDYIIFPALVNFLFDENNVLNSVWQFTIGYKIKI